MYSQNSGLETGPQPAFTLCIYRYIIINVNIFFRLMIKQLFLNIFKTRHYNMTVIYLLFFHLMLPKIV